MGSHEYRRLRRWKSVFVDARDCFWGIRKYKKGFPRLVLQSDRGKGVPSFDEMMDIALVEVDFDDPTMNVRGRRALAIAKPTPRGY